MRTSHMYRSKPPPADRDAFTPITALAARQALERTIGDVEAQGEQIGGLAAQVAQTHALSLKTAAAVAALGREQEVLTKKVCEVHADRLTPKRITAACGGIAIIVTAVATLVTAWGTASAKAEAREQSKVTTAQTYDARAAADRDRLVRDAVAAQAERDRELWSARVLAERVEAERRASMRKP